MVDQFAKASFIDTFKSSLKDSSDGLSSATHAPDL